jgi:uncharacterized protein with GYD domain
MARYTLLVKADPARVRDVIEAIRALPPEPVTGVKLYHSMNVFGEWDFCIWFEAETPDNAVDFVQRKILTIPGIQRTYTLPSTTIKEYR